MLAQPSVPQGRRLTDEFGGAGRVFFGAIGWTIVALASSAGKPTLAFMAGAGEAWVGKMRRCCAGETGAPFWLTSAGSSAAGAQPVRADAAIKTAEARRVRMA